MMRRVSTRAPRPRLRRPSSRLRPRMAASTPVAASCARSSRVAHAARCLDAHRRHEFAQPAVELDIRAGEHAVAIDVGAQQMDRTGGGVTRREIVEPCRLRLQPSRARQCPCAVDQTRVERDAKPVGTETSKSTVSTFSGSRTATLPRTTRDAPASNKRFDVRPLANAAAGLDSQTDSRPARATQRRLLQCRRRARRRDRRHAASARR